MRTSGFEGVALVALATLLAPPILAAESARPARVALHWLYSAADSNSIYTVSAERRDRLVRERGYADMGPIGYVDAIARPRSRPFRCFYIGPPRIDAFCTTSALEQKILRAMGYEETGIEGYLPTEHVAGSTVLYRMSRLHGPDAHDREHRFVVDPGELERLRKLGWAYDGSKGFVYLAP